MAVAFDAACIATFRAPMLLAADPHALRRADADDDPERPFLRACVLESIRLWPTTPVILRESDRVTTWQGATIAAGTSFVVHMPFLHRDAERLAYADRFAPDIWLDDTAHRDTLVPFSGDPAECPARHLVLTLASATLGTLVCDRRLMLSETALDTDHLPATLDPFTRPVFLRSR